jgi:hypothetical protein
MQRSSLKSVLFVLIISLFTTCKSPVEVDLYGDINGIVTNELTKAPISGAIVTLSPSNGSTQTGSDGKYSFTKLDPQDYKIQVTIDGYVANTKNLTVTAGENTYGDISLTPLLPVLDVSEMQLDFGESISQLTLVISNTGKGDLIWSLVKSVDWLSINPTSGKTTAEKSSILFTVDRSKLSVGTYSTEVSVLSNAGTKLIRISMLVADQLSPKVTTGTVINVTQTTADITGTVVGLGVGAVLKYGHCYSTLPNPTIADAKTDLGTLAYTGAYTSSLTGLLKNTTYFVRAYATNSIGTGYSSQITFTTSDSPMLPNVTIQDITSITPSSANVGGGIASIGNTNILQYGHCWSINTNPTTADAKTTLGSKSSIGTYNSVLNYLLPGTTYYVRAYATNEGGTTYSSESSFTTLPTPVPPSLTTGTVSNITLTGAQIIGNVTAIGTSNITQFGHCWSTNTNPTISDTKTQLGSRTLIGEFTSVLTNLQPGATYNIRAYAVNSDGVSYGNQVQFTTVAQPVATIVTNATSGITSNSATFNGSITDLGSGQTVTEYGFCFSINVTPTVLNTKLVVGSYKTYIGTFTSNAGSLSQNTMYYVRTYAIIGGNIIYGNQINFTTLTALATLTTSTATSVTSNTAICGGNITNDGGAPITERGLCWSTTSTPTIANSKTSDGAGTGLFSSSLTNLSGITTYYARAYATNIVGTAYGNQISFTTTKSVPILTTKNITEITAMGGVTGGTISSNGGGTISARGICWSDAPNPTIDSYKTNSTATTTSYSTAITTAVPSTTYYVRAYATNEVGTGYGDEKSFITLDAQYYTSFESGMTPSGWSGQFTVSNIKAFNGSYSLKSLDGLGSDAILTKTLTNPGQISFYFTFYHSYARNGQSIDFYIDNVKIVNYVMNTTDWYQSLVNVSAGTHTFKWHFNPVYGGDNCNIDQIIITK